MDNRCLKDENGKTYFDRLREQMQKNRTYYESKPVVPIANNYGSIYHEKIDTLSQETQRFRSINSQTIPRSV